MLRRGVEEEPITPAALKRGGGGWPAGQLDIYICVYTENVYIDIYICTCIYTHIIFIMHIYNYIIYMLF